MFLKVLKLSIFSCLLFIISVGTVNAYYNPGNSTGFVNDYARILSTEQKQTLENKLTQFEKETSSEVSVVTISNLQGDTVENFAVELFKDWGIGKKGKDNGILMLVAIQDRKMRIEVGYGLEEKVTDAQASWIINNVMKPAFQKNDYYSGINEAVDKIILVLSGREISSTDKTINSNFPNSEGKKDIGAWILLLFSPFLLLYLGLNLASNKKKWPISILIGILLSFYLYYLSKFFFIKGVEKLAIWMVAFFVLDISIILGRNKSWWEGGVLGILAATSISYFFNTWTNIWWYAGILGIGGFIFDFLVSRVVKRGKGSSWWLGSRGSGSGGFGGGSSGGGGASGSW